MVKSNTKHLSYSGVPARLVEYRLTKGAVRHVDVLTWDARAVGQEVEHEAGTVVVTLVDGVGHGARLIMRLTFTPGTEQADILASVATLLGA